MKKLLILLLIATLALLVFAGCEGLVPSEGEGEGEGETEEVTVEIDGMVELGGKTWIACGDHDITITFPAPVENTFAYITMCSGYYGSADEKTLEYSGDVVLFPNEDKTVWTGSGFFGCHELFRDTKQPVYQCTSCCASYVEVEAGECEPGTCISFPIVVDCDLPYAKIEVTSEACECEGCEVTFASVTESEDCAEAEECCGDDCSGLAGWSIAIYEDDPFDICCETPCEEPIYTCSGTECPIECTTDCLEEGEYYYVVANLVDNVGNEVEYYGIMGLYSECEVIISQYLADGYNCECTTWDDGYGYINHEYIGQCYPWDNCVTNGG